MAKSRINIFLTVFFIAVVAAAVALVVTFVDLGGSDPDPAQTDDSVVTDAPVDSPVDSPVDAPTEPPIFTFPSASPIGPVKTSPPTDVPIMCLPDDFTSTPLDTSVECQNGVVRSTRIFNLLSTITAPDVLLNEATAQGKAYAFLINYDSYLGGEYCGSVDILQRYGLMTLYFASGGDDWSNRSGWCNVNKHCTWNGVTCTDGSVTKLELESNNLVGRIPRDVFFCLDGLEEVNLFANSLSGPIPNSIKMLSNLKMFDVQENVLTGTAFPQGLTKVNPSVLTSYKVSGNKFSGTIPEELDNLSNLEELWAESNELSGTIPATIGPGLRKLTRLYLSGNNINGSVPTNLALIPLEELLLSDNQFESSIPEELFYLGSLISLHLDNNLFSGSLPTWIGLMTNLQDFSVQGNDLDGVLPTQLGLLTDLVDLYLGDNKWSGTVPDIFSNLQELENIDMSNTGLVGSIPSKIFTLPNLMGASFVDTLFSGSIPASFVNADELLYFHVDGSSGISGTVPSVPSGKLQKLQEFMVQGTGLTGSMPASICALRSEGVLDLLEATCTTLECSLDCCTACF